MMRFRPLTRHDAWRSIPQTLCMRGFGLAILAAFGLIWPDLALTMALVDIGIICLLFALVDLFVAAAIRRESTCSARKIGALGLLGSSFGALGMVMVMTPLYWMRAAVAIWLVGSGGAIILLGSPSSRRGSASVITQFGALQLALAFLFVMAHPSRADLLLHAGLSYAGLLGAAQVVLGLTLRKGKAVGTRPVDLGPFATAQLTDSGSDATAQLT
jgi:hypothetical protein